MQWLKQSLKQLLIKAATDLPADVRSTIKSAAASVPKRYSYASYILEHILKNIDMSSKTVRPICQDTGAVILFANIPEDWQRRAFEDTVRDAIVVATTDGYLRENLTNILKTNQPKCNSGIGFPIIYTRHWNKSTGEIKIILKGGGSENVSTQYSLPDPNIGAERNLDGVRKAALDAVFRAQGYGCAPGFLGVCIGGSRSTGYITALEQLLRPLNDTNPQAPLAELEHSIIKQANQLNIGPMGLGGSPTVLGCKIGTLDRHIASYFVTVSYMCWAFRRQGIKTSSDGKIIQWIY